MEVGGEGAFVEVPVGHVAAGVAEDVDAGEEAGGEVHPFLIDEEAGAAFAEAEGEAAALPPGEEGIGGGGDGEEAEVVGAVVEEVLFGGVEVVVDGGGDVGGEDGVVGFEGLEDGSERGVDGDVGVEVDEAVERVLRRAGGA